jgi:uncharacterized DUF497 family protein
MFEYDPEKSAINEAKHGIDFEAAQALWSDNNRTEIDVVSEVEPRTAVTGMIGGRLWTAIVTMRDETVRIISVRRAWEKEIRRYGTQAN